MSSSDRSVNAFEEERLSVRAKEFRSEAEGVKRILSLLARVTVDILKNIANELGSERVEVASRHLVKMERSSSLPIPSRARTPENSREMTQGSSVASVAGLVALEGVREDWRRL